MSKNNSKKIGIIIFILIFLGLSFFVFRKPVQQGIKTIGKIELIFNTLEKFESIFNIVAENQKKFIEQEERDKIYQEKIDNLKTLILNLTDEVEKQEIIANEQSKRVEELLKMIEERPEQPPEDFEECVEQLNSAYRTIDLLDVVVDTQKEEISSLRAINTSQGVIIEHSMMIIEMREEQVETWKDAAKSARRWGNIKTAGGMILVYIIMTII